MGSSSTEFPDVRFPAEAFPREAPLGPRTVRAPRPPEQRIRRHVVLFMATMVTASLAGADRYASFASGIGTIPFNMSVVQLLVHGLWYAVAVLAILGAHEFGHYFACRYYGVNASPPYFIPFWLPFVFTPGTLGAVIRIREPIATKRQFFDIGIAGPIAGFVVIVPVLILAMSLSTVVKLPANFEGIDFGEPLLFKLISWSFFGSLPQGYSVNLHPMGWAAWFGLMATALNLVPAGQLDGGHISYAVFGRRSSLITLAATLVMIGLVVVTRGGYIVWAIVLLVMLRLMGRHHPRAIDEDEPIGTARCWLAALAAVILILSFTPIPYNIITR